jgi:hypothetical protein
MRYRINQWIDRHIPLLPGEYSRLDMLDGLPRNAASVTR